ncbi:TetR/AcrR family transcriptional regulator [Microcella sp.]|uniref:TetR/AcrR family transcriptional regulator n=1 Tax=Microcella sp. TaxID=1913979 RepID=UPI00299F6EFB|nr:TetR/AcrR family transcriptional regulator C-terminal domain-containing protein [Microcella sp.]MDX2025335.1 TetR/AcrR family transcriptional regulator C-terminal domain-containing protein [Microcella sp.]
MATPGPARRLSESAVLDAAFAVVAEHGFDALSIRRVASALGVSPNALYTYVADRADLLRGMVERVMAAIDLSALETTTLSPADRLEQFAVEMRRTLLGHPGGAALIMTGPIDGPHSLLLNEALLRTVVDAGYSLDDAARASYSLQVYVLGTVMLEAADGGTGDPEREEALAVERRAALEHVDASGVPLTAQTADIVARYNTTEQFRWGIRRLIDGMLTTPSS